MILELKDKVSEMVDATYTSTSTSVSGNLKEEAVSALQSLGFKKRDSEEAVTLAARNGNSAETVQELVKLALAQLNT